MHRAYGKRFEASYFPRHPFCSKTFTYRSNVLGEPFHARPSFLLLPRSLTKDDCASPSLRSVPSDHALQLLECALQILPSPPAAAVFPGPGPSGRFLMSLAQVSHEFASVSPPHPDWAAAPQKTWLAIPQPKEPSEVGV